MEYKALAEDLIAKCHDAGADAAEIFIESGRNLNIEVRNGEIETVQESSDRGAGVRVIVGSRLGFSHSNDMSEPSLHKAIESAVAFAKQTTPESYNALPDDSGVTEVKALYDPEIAKISMDEKIRLAKQVESEAMKDRRITKSAGASYSEGETSYFLVNSHGLSKSYRSTVCVFGGSVVAEKGDQKSSGGEYCARRFFSDLKSVNEVAEKAAEDAYSMLDPRMVRTQKCPVVFDPDVARAILGGIHAAVNGERVLQGASFLRDMLDQSIASELLTIVDDGTRAKGLSSRPFDGEGVPTQRRVLVDKGVLKGFMYNTIAARRAGVKSTGNASRGGFDGLPGIGAHQLYIEAGSSTPEEIIQSVENGLLLKGVTGYGINAVNGNFSGGASGFWIKNGRIAFPVKGLTIAGTADEMLNSIDMVGNDLDLNRNFTGPTFRIREMQIGGE